MAPGGLSRPRSSAQVPSQPVVNSSTSTPSTSTGDTEKGGRKRAANNALHNHIKRGGGKPTIDIPVGKARPLGIWGSQWMTEIGITVRQNAPATTHTWKDVTPQQKETMYEIILDKFDMDMDQLHVKKVVYDAMRDMFKDSRHDLHKHYLDIPDGIDKCERPFPMVSQESWESLRVWFGPADFKKRSITNKVNRQKLEYNHRGSSKPFVKHRYEQIFQKNPETNEEPTRPEFYKSMHHNIAKGWIAPKAQENYVINTFYPSHLVLYLHH